MAWAVSINILRTVRHRSRARPGGFVKYISTLQSVYWGRSLSGVDDAALGYFDKRREDLTVEESFYLIERLASPNRSSTKRVAVILKRASIVEVLTRNGSSIVSLEAFYASMIHHSAGPIDSNGDTRKTSLTPGSNRNMGPVNPWGTNATHSLRRSRDLSVIHYPSRQNSD
jgi:hypothetical protein